jgi:thiosulfate/3-mercaptopyruvate sulfurtransferase
MKLSTLIGAETLAAHLDDERLLIVDCRFDLADTDRGAREFAQAHVPGAVYADLNRDLSDLSKPGLGRHPLPSAAAFSQVLSRWGWTADTPVVANDAAAGAIAAARLWWMLRVTGARNVAVLDGGLAAWQAAGLPLDAERAARAPSDVHVEFASSEIVYNEQLYALQKSGDGMLLDARAAPRFRGEVEPIDALAGHIPGARNRPTTDNLQPNGRFKSAEMLREEFSALIGTHPLHHIVHSCGSGVSACHNLLAMEHAGLAGSRLYAPSWSGWIADPANPVARG